MHCSRIVIRKSLLNLLIFLFQVEDYGTYAKIRGHKIQWAGSVAEKEICISSP